MNATPGLQGFQSLRADQREMLRERLRWRYGIDHAARILSGQDETANADLRAWNNLGKPLRTERP